LSGYVDFAGVYDRLTAEIDYKKRGEYFDACIQKHGGIKGILLDLGCGTGTMCEVMAALGYDVIGVDSSYEMLMKAMEKRSASGADITYLAQSMTELDMFGTLDVVISTLDSLNHLTDYAAFDKAIAGVALFLHPEGVFVFDVNTVYKHEAVLKNNTFVYDMDDIYCVWQNTLKEGHLVQMDLDIFVQEEDAYYRTEDHFAERAYTHEEIIASLEKHGMKLEAVYHEDSFDPPREDSQRLIYVAKMAHSVQSAPKDNRI